MKIVGQIGGRSSSFQELLQSFSQMSARSRVLKTIQESGYFTDGFMLTRLLPKELEEINHVHYDMMVSNSEYKESQPLNIKEKAIPKLLRTEATKIIVPKKAKSEEERVVAVEGNNIRIYFYESVFFRFFHRISQLMPGRPIERDTSWWLGRKNSPIAVIDEGSFYRGRLLGTLAQIPIERKEDIDFGKPKLKRVFKKNLGWYYKEVGE
ncbi:hypothetical protein C4577_04200 [Candidatus Parcubacteria bacterium]|nr:MAG: hypothetical protein C4577_04200 [Candidatus Parcubacteria bacterium]